MCVCVREELGKANVILMIHISREELLKKIEQEHDQLFENDQEDLSSVKIQKEDMSSILPTTYSILRDNNNNTVGASASDEEGETQAVLITGRLKIKLKIQRHPKQLLPHC